jgi:hypothetical protein
MQGDWAADGTTNEEGEGAELYLSCVILILASLDRSNFA